MNHPHRNTATALATGLLLATLSAAVQANGVNDVVVRPPAGGGFSVQDNPGAHVRLRVDEGGAVYVPGLVTGSTQTEPTCFNTTSGQLGPCASGPAASTGSLIASASTYTATLTTTAGGISGDQAVLPMFGYVATAPVTTSPGSRAFNNEASAMAQPVAVSTIKGFSANLMLKSAYALIGTTVSIQAVLYLGDVNSATMTEVPGANCSFAPSLTGIVSAGTPASCTTTGLAIPVSSGQVGYIVVRATAAGISLINSIQTSVAASVTGVQN